MPIITTYQCSQDVRTIQKTVTNAVEYNCEILDTVNSFAPRIRLFCTSETCSVYRKAGVKYGDKN